MSIKSKQIRKVIINGQWFDVRLDSFQVHEMEFTDEQGNPVHNFPLELPAYKFTNDNGDVYYGPLSAIELYKLMDV